MLFKFLQDLRSGNIQLAPAIVRFWLRRLAPSVPQPHALTAPRRTHSQAERFADGRWQALAPADRLTLGQLDAQVWLALHNLLLEPACRCGPKWGGACNRNAGRELCRKQGSRGVLLAVHATPMQPHAPHARPINTATIHTQYTNTPRAKYDPDDYRRSALQRLRRHLTEPLLDQLPPLKGLQRLLDEMALGAADAAPSAAATSRLFGGGGGGGDQGGRARLILEQVPLVRERLVKGRDWGAYAKTAAAGWLGEAAARLARERAERMIKSFEFMCAMDDPGARGGAAGVSSASAAAAAAGGLAASSDDGCVRIECWRRVRGGVHERWCEFDAPLDGGKQPEGVVVRGEGGGEARGLRHRLAAVGEDTTRPLPCDGKVREGGCRGNPACLRSCLLAQHGACLGVVISPSLCVTHFATSLYAYVSDCGALPRPQGGGVAAAAERRAALAGRHPCGPVADSGAACDRRPRAAAAAQACGKGEGAAAAAAAHACLLQPAAAASNQLPSPLCFGLLQLQYYDVRLPPSHAALTLPPLATPSPLSVTRCRVCGTPTTQSAAPSRCWRRAARPRLRPRRRRRLLRAALTCAAAVCASRGLAAGCRRASDALLGCVLRRWSSALVQLPCAARCKAAIVQVRVARPRHTRSSQVVWVLRGAEASCGGRYGKCVCRGPPSQRGQVAGARPERGGRDAPRPPSTPGAPLLPGGHPIGFNRCLAIHRAQNFASRPAIALLL